jgi:hypothetical protein
LSCLASICLQAGPKWFHLCVVDVRDQYLPRLLHFRGGYPIKPSIQCNITSSAVSGSHEITTA